MSVSLAKVFSPIPGWYCGDFHSHTTCSDGAFTPKQLCELSMEHGLDFLAITDHNSVRAFDDFDDSFDRLILPGIEVTFKEGHYNVFGFDGNTESAQQIFRTIVDRSIIEVFEKGRSHEDLTEIFERISGAGLFISINHPLLWPWEWRDNETEIAFFDGIEIINDPTYRDNPQANPATRRMWSAWLNAGYRITALGGTDFHSLQPSDDRTRLSLLNLPLTYVYTQEFSPQAILEGIRRRNVYVSMGPKVEFEAHRDGQKYLMGSDLGDNQSQVQLFARVTECSTPARALLIHNGELVIETPIRDGYAEIEYKMPPAKQEIGWYRFDVIDEADQTIALTNPFYFGSENTPAKRTFGSFLGDFCQA